MSVLRNAKLLLTHCRIYLRSKVKRLACILLVLAVAVIGLHLLKRRLQCGGSQSRPENPDGWKESNYEGAKYIGSFALGKGEATDNGQIGVQVVDIKPGNCPQTNYEMGGSSAKLRFFRPSDQKTICETELQPSSSTSYDAFRACSRDLPFNRISINIVDSDENWVSFSLWTSNSF